MYTSQKIFITISLVGSAILIGLSFDAPEIVLRFLLVGELPDGTTLLSPDTMLIITGVCFVATLLILIPRLSIRAVAKTLSVAPKLRLPHHRYTSL